MSCILSLHQNKQFDIRYQPLFIKRQLSKPFIMSQNSCLAESSLTCFNHNKTIWIAWLSNSKVFIWTFGLRVLPIVGYLSL